MAAVAVKIQAPALSRPSQKADSTKKTREESVYRHATGDKNSCGEELNESDVELESEGLNFKEVDILP